MPKRTFAVVAQMVVLSTLFAPGAVAQNLTLPALKPVQQQTLVEARVEPPQALSRSIELQRTNPAQQLHVTVSLPYGDPEGIQAFVDDVNNPKSPNYRHFLTPTQVGDRFGLPYARMQEVADYLKSNGLTVDLLAKNHLSVSATGTVAQAEAAFHTTFKNFHSAYPEAGNRDFFSFSSPVQLPVSIAPYVQNISGLENYTKPQFRQVLDPNRRLDAAHAAQNRKSRNVPPYAEGVVSFSEGL